MYVIIKQKRHSAYIEERPCGVFKYYECVCMLTLSWLPTLEEFNITSSNFWLQPYHKHIQYRHEIICIYTI